MKLPFLQSKAQAAPPASLKLSHGQAAGQFLANTGKLLQHQGQNMLQDHSTLRRNSLIISTLILVLSRIGIANASAIKANGTPDESHRKKEAIKTTIRELGGWTLGYVVFRGIENAVKIYLQNTLKYQTNRASSLMGFLHRMSAEVKKAFSRTQGRLDKLPVPLPEEFKLLEQVKKKGPLHQDKLLTEEAAEKALKEWKPGAFFDRLITRFTGSSATSLQKLAKLHTWLPLVAGGIPAVILSGYMLEWFTQNHSQKVIDAIAHSKGEPVSPEAAQPQPTPPSSAASFDAYLQQIQLKRAERGLP